MPEIKYVVVSDLHMGAENSLMTNLKPGTYVTDNSKASPVLEKLITCLREVISKNPERKRPQIIFNGDLIELALTTANEAAMAFQRFLELAMPEDESEWLFDREMIIIPGNHDHNLWETARYAHFIDNIQGLKPGERIDAAVHMTQMFNPAQIESRYLTSLAHVYPHLKEKGVAVRAIYPAFALLHHQKEKCLVVSHGHFIESMYSLMTTVDSLFFPDRIPPALLNDLESENYAWIDFFWSTLGRSGNVGKDVSLLYDKMQDPEQVSRLIDSFAESISLSQHNPVKKWIEKEVLEEVLKLTVGKAAANERSQDGILTPETVLGLHKYIEVFIRNQLEFELNGNFPTDLTFLFGHTHKPFEQDMNFEGYESYMKVYNSGGWVVDTLDEMPFHGGSVLLVDENLNTVSLQMYKEGKYMPTLEVSGHDQHLDKNDLYLWLLMVINFNEGNWKAFEQTIETEVKLRYKYLKEIIQSKN
jgi:metallophosphoesterase superfamily enzyme